ncbi:hypothetical protein F5890DRAFT_1557158 [Lentinula detonsa]|uniref:Uncharacterized protein n=1 Tax=Lentinula detonsa TaxID=2804962 RepID=A0AA38PTP2_9AGAR|nr:hypothetical protein F5890DRAFT_1557158 [Lentinula detonsa]
MTSSISTQDIFDASNSRAAQRKARLMQIEYQQQLEDMEALKMSEEQRYSLMQSFSSVKVEFCDLDGLQWTGSALRKRTVSRPDSSSGILSQRLNLNENFPRRARAQTLFCPSSPSISSASPLPSSSYFPSLDTSHPSSNCRGSEALTVLNNVGFAPGFDEKTVRAVVSPVKAALVSQKHSVSSRQSDSRPPAKQRRRSRSPAKGAFNMHESSTISSAKHNPGSGIMPTAIAESTPVYTDGAPMERLESRSQRRSLTRTYTQAEVTSGVSHTVATEVMRGRERLRGLRDSSKLPDPLAHPIMICDDDEVLESDLVGVGPIRLSPSKATRKRPGEFAAQFATPVTASAQLFQDVVEDPFMTPTPERFGTVTEFPTAPETPVHPRRSGVDFTLLKRKRQSSESQNEAEQKP